jgi:hypothetical protein
MGSGQWHGGKGSRYRPINKDQYDKNYEEIFGKKKNKKKTTAKKQDKIIKKLDDLFDGKI